MRDSYFYIKAFVAGYEVIVTDVVNSTIYTWVVLLELVNINILNTVGLPVNLTFTLQGKVLMDDLGYEGVCKHCLICVTLSTVGINTLGIPQSSSLFQLTVYASRLHFTSLNHLDY